MPFTAVNTHVLNNHIKNKGRIKEMATIIIIMVLIGIICPEARPCVMMFLPGVIIGTIEEKCNTEKE